MAKPTIKDLLDQKGKRKLTLTTAFDYSIARACELARLDILVTFPQNSGTLEELLILLEQVRKGAPNTLVAAAIPRYVAWASDTDAMRCALAAMKAGADIIFASGMELGKFRVLAKQRIPFVGHVGFVPVHSTWYGGPRAVGKTHQEARQVYEETLAFQEAGAIGVEMECVPYKVAAEITKKMNLLVFSMGSGGGCDGQYLFSCDVLGTHDGHYPRHSKSYRHFFQDSVEAFRQYRDETTSGVFPTSDHLIEIEDEEFDQFAKAIKPGE